MVGTGAQLFLTHSHSASWWFNIDNRIHRFLSVIIKFKERERERERLKSILRGGNSVLIDNLHGTHLKIWYTLKKGDCTIFRMNSLLMYYLILYYFL